MEISPAPAPERLQSHIPVANQLADGAEVPATDSLMAPSFFQVVWKDLMSHAHGELDY